MSPGIRTLEALPQGAPRIRDRVAAFDLDAFLGDELRIAAHGLHHDVGGALEGVAVAGLEDDVAQVAVDRDPGSAGDAGKVPAGVDAQAQRAAGVDLKGGVVGAGVHVSLLDACLKRIYLWRRLRALDEWHSCLGCGDAQTLIENTLHAK
jgi:hypothetical protein